MLWHCCCSWGFDADMLFVCVYVCREKHGDYFGVGVAGSPEAHPDLTLMLNRCVFCAVCAMILQGEARGLLWHWCCRLP
jgi:hypothetical protein